MIANVLHVIVFSLNTISLCYFGWHPQFVDMGQKMELMSCFRRIEPRTRRKKLLPRLDKKEKWWLHKLQKENAGTTKWATTKRQTLN